MARNRQRARDRKRRAAQQGGDGGDGANLHAGEQPASTSGEVDEFEAAMATGGGEDAAGAVDESELEAEALQARGDLDEDGDVDEDDAALVEEAAATAPVAARTRAPAGPGGGPRFIQFIRGSWAELQRVQWPDRRQVAQATAVVLGFVVVAGAYLGVADYIAKQLVDFIL